MWGQRTSGADGSNAPDVGHWMDKKVGAESRRSVFNAYGASGGWPERLQHYKV